MKIGDRIKDLRESKGLTQRELTQLMKMSPTQYARVEKNVVDPRISTIQKICKALNITFYDFFLPYKTNSELAGKLSMIEKLSKEEQESIFTLVKSLLDKK